MYWSPSQFPSLSNLTRAEREAILRSALKEHNRGYRIRYMVLVVAISALGMAVVDSGFGTWLARASMADWRKWAPLGTVVALIFGA